jgi:hypothetical protein
MSDEQLEALFDSLAVAERQMLLEREVDQALEAVGAAILAEARAASALQSEASVRVRKRRRGERVFAIGAAACVLAVAGVSVSALLPGRASRTSPSGPVAPLGPASASAATVLEKAARTAARQPGPTLRPGELEYVKTIQGLTSGGYEADTTGQLVGIRFWQTDTLETWGNLKGVRRRRTDNIRERFFSATDQAIARAHHMTLAQLDHTDASAPDHYDMIYPAKDPEGPGVHPPDLFYSWPSLPTKPAALLAALKRQLRSAHGQATPVALFTLISNGPLFNATTPALRSALYEVLAHLPGVELLGQRRDPLGRLGIAIGIHGKRTSGLVTLFDPESAEELETEMVFRSPSRNMHIPTFPRGTPISYTVFISRGIVNSISQLPDGGHLSTKGASKVVYDYH